MLANPSIHWAPVWRWGEVYPRQCVAPVWRCATRHPSGPLPGRPDFVTSTSTPTDWTGPWTSGWSMAVAEDPTADPGRLSASVALISVVSRRAYVNSRMG